VSGAVLTITVPIESANDYDDVRRRLVLAVESELETMRGADLLDGHVSARWDMHLSGDQPVSL
jgi:hypothetical protein